MSAGHDFDKEGGLLSPPIVNPAENGPAPSASSGMNLAVALAEKRQMRVALDPDIGASLGTPARVSLMRFLEEAEGFDGDGWVCCVFNWKLGRKRCPECGPCGEEDDGR